MPRPPNATDLYDLRVPVEVALSPDGEQVCFALKYANPEKDGYRTSLWLVPADGSAPARQLTMGAKTETSPRWSPDGRTIAFLSDREGVLVKGGASPDAALDEAPDEGKMQVWLLPMGGGEPRQLTRFPQDAKDIAWSPDGRQVCVVSGATTAERDTDRKRQPGDPPDRDAHLVDRLQYMLNAEGYIYKHPPKLWLVDVSTGEARQLTRGRSRDEHPSWSPSGRLIAFTSNRHRDADLSWRHDIYVVEVRTGAVRRVTRGRGDRDFQRPVFSPDGRWIGVAGHRFTSRVTTQADVWRFRADRESDGENLTAGAGLDATAYMNSDLLGFSPTKPAWSADGGSLLFAAPVEGSYELWRVGVEDRGVERMTRDRHYLCRADAVGLPGGGMRVAAMRVDASTPPEIAVIDVPAGEIGSRGLRARKLTGLNEAWREIEITAPEARWHEVDGRRIQGWFYRAPDRDGRPAALVVEIHGGPSTLYGWSLMWEWQCLVAAGMSVYACNPRGSQGYGQDFVSANYRDWGDGPMRDIMAGVDSLIADGLVDGDRLGVTGGSYGGYLTSWIVGHTDRFRAAVSARSVNDMTSEMLSGDISGPLFGRHEYGANPWEDPELYRLHSPITYAANIRTPLLIQHAENDLRTPITQGEELFTVLRSLRRPVRMLRVPEENHELTRSGAPHRRVENIERIRDWFRHFLVEGKRRLPPT